MNKVLVGGRYRDRSTLRVVHRIPSAPTAISSSSSSSSSIYFGQRPGTRSHNTRFGPILVTVIQDDGHFEVNATAPMVGELQLEMRWAVGRGELQAATTRHTVGTKGTTCQPRAAASAQEDSRDTHMHKHASELP